MLFFVVAGWQRSGGMICGDGGSSKAVVLEYSKNRKPFFRRVDMMRILSPFSLSSLKVVGDLENWDIISSFHLSSMPCKDGLSKP